MESPHSCTLNVQATIVASSSSMSTPFGPCFLDHVLPFKWSKMFTWFFQNSMPTFYHIHIVVHLPCWFGFEIWIGVFAFYGCVVGGTFFLSIVGWFGNSRYCLWGIFNIYHGYMLHLLQLVDGVQSPPILNQCQKLMFPCYSWDYRLLDPSIV